MYGRNGKGHKSRANTIFANQPQYKNKRINNCGKIDWKLRYLVFTAWRSLMRLAWGMRMKSSNATIIGTTFHKLSWIFRRTQISCVSLWCHHYHMLVVRPKSFHMLSICHSLYAKLSKHTQISEACRFPFICVLEKKKQKHKLHATSSNFKFRRKKCCLIISIARR